MATYLCLFKDLTEAEELYDKLTKKVGSLGGSAAGNINQRAKDMKKEAEDLLKKATEGLEKLKSMCQSTVVLELYVWPLGFVARQALPSPL